LTSPIYSIDGRPYLTLPPRPSLTLTQEGEKRVLRDRRHL